ncbi:rab-GTPase-TBC domain-containing protein [Blakeslea trispora]|nr:rab-GTPase-TBC domain-containing protein [Blakeslea trispora]
METHLRPFLATCKSEELLQIPDGPIKITETIGGLGLRFGYHSDANEAKDQRRLKLWLNYFHENGRNLTLVRHPVFHKMVRAGLPNDLRGEIWESCSGSIYLRLLNQGVYQHILDSHKDTDSYVKEEIEKDLHRSLPEYEAYQSSEGIDRLRRVLIAYSWKNPELGYCQAMNIVTSSLLIYMTEEQAFWALNTLVDHLCPGYYSSSMYGVLLDQVVLEELVKQYLPKVLEHLHQKEIQLSVACLPWFLTLYINSMPLPFAFRILDCFFLEGPKILFQIALAVLKMNEEELLTVEDDSELLMVAKGFFKTLNINTSDSDSGAAEEDSEVARRLELFNNLMRSAYTDFGKVTSSQIIELRKKNELRVIGGVESFTKRNALRNIRNTSCFSQDEISIVYDYFSTALYYANDHQDRMTIPDMNLKAFTNMFESMTTWANSIKSNYSEADANEQNASDVRFAQQIIQSFIQRLFENFKTENKSGITLTDTIAKLGDMLRGDIMSKAAFFFSLYDHETKDQMLTNQEFYQLINEFFLLLNLLDMPEFHPLDTITKLITLSAEQTNTPAAMASLHEQLESISKDPNYRILVDKDGKKINLSKTRKITEAIRDLLTGSEAPVIEITLPVFRMIILTEEHLDQFIQTKFPQSFKLQKSLIETQKGLGHEIFEALLVEGKKFANNMTVKNDGRLSAAEVVANSRSFHPKSPKTTLSASSNLEDDYELI